MANDRITKEMLEGSSLPKPKVEIIVGDSRIVKPGMRTYFVDPDSNHESYNNNASGVIRSEKTVVGTVCTCDTVCTCEAYTVCTCQAYMVCTCEAHTVCTCDGQCSCQSNYSSGCSCNQVCTCVPVH